jgi:hypothetical protein
VQAYQNTLFNSLVSIERTERSAVGDHFGWHPSAGPDVGERQGHVFVNNLLVADETFAGPMLEFKQSAVLKERLKDPEAKEIDGNVYVRRARPTVQTFIEWSPVQNEKGLVATTALEEFQKLDSRFEAKALSFPDYWGPLFQSTDLHNFNLLSAFPGSTNGVALAPAIRELWKLKPGQPVFPGAYVPHN